MLLPPVVPPHEQLLMAAVGGAAGGACHTHRERWGDTAIAPEPLCEQMLAAVGCGCWCWRSSPPHLPLLRVSTPRAVARGGSWRGRAGGWVLVVVIIVIIKIVSHKKKMRIKKKYLQPKRH